MIRILSWIPGFYPTSINKLPLPSAYLQLERLGRWRPPSIELLETVFGEKPGDPCFYTRDYLSRENKNLPDRIADDEYFIGDHDETLAPGRIRKNKVVFIGDLGVDRPIALDYQENYYEPSIIYLRWTPVGSRWVKIADTFEELIKMLKLNGTASDG